MKMEKLANQHKNRTYDERNSFNVEERKCHLNKKRFTLATEEMMTLQMIRLESRPKLSSTRPLYLSKKDKRYHRTSKTRMI